MFALLLSPSPPPALFLLFIEGKGNARKARSLTPNALLSVPSSILSNLPPQTRTLISRMPSAELVSSLTIAFVAAMLPPSIPIMYPVFPLSGPASNRTWAEPRQGQSRPAGGQTRKRCRRKGCWNCFRLFTANQRCIRRSTATALRVLSAPSFRRKSRVDGMSGLERGAYFTSCQQRYTGRDGKRQDRRSAVVRTSCERQTFLRDEKIAARSQAAWTCVCVISHPKSQDDSVLEQKQAASSRPDQRRRLFKGTGCRRQRTDVLSRLNSSTSTAKRRDSERNISFLTLS